jgi:3-oxo-5-alpha-steroid 4-dehydrogenase 1
MFSDPEALYDLGVAVALFWALVTFVFLFWVEAPYGRHMREGWGPSVRSRFGWIAMELPAPFCFAVAYMTGSHASEPIPLIFLLLFQAHYLHRTFVFPLLMRWSHKQNAALMVMTAVVFNAANGWLCGTGVSEIASYDSTWLRDPRFGLGLLLFAVGAVINLRSDAVLRGLRTADETGYRIPHGGLYRWISCPNYLGEIVQWTGWAVATWSLAGLSFALWTAANLVPRAIAHHRWYREQFEEYPTERRALVPGLL